MVLGRILFCSTFAAICVLQEWPFWQSDGQSLKRFVLLNIGRPHYVGRRELDYNLAFAVVLEVRLLPPHHWATAAGVARGHS